MDIDEGHKSGRDFPAAVLFSTWEKVGGAIYRCVWCSSGVIYLAL